MEDRSCIYKIYKLTFPNGMIYIGMTKQSMRWRLYAGYRHNKNMMTAIAKWGKQNIQKEILVDNLSLEEADLAEIQYIQQYDSTNPKVGYNISRGGIKAWKGMHHSKESRQKMSISGKGKHSGIHNANFGKTRTDYENEINRKAHQRFMHPVHQFDKQGNYITTFESVSAAARSVNTSNRNIRMCLTGTSNTACGYKWKYAEGSDNYSTSR